MSRQHRICILGLPSIMHADVQPRQSFFEDCAHPPGWYRAFFYQVLGVGMSLREESLLSRFLHLFLFPLSLHSLNLSYLGISNQLEYALINGIVQVALCSFFLIPKDNFINKVGGWGLRDCSFLPVSQLRILEA